MNQIVNGLKEGYWEEYKNNTLSQRGHYIGGKKEGYWEEYYDSLGSLNGKFFYNNGSFSYVEQYSLNGDLLTKGHYIGCYRNGYWEEYKNNKLYLKINYIEGKLDGLYEKFDENGKLINWKYYKDDIDITDKYIKYGDVTISKAEWREKQINSILGD